MSCAFDTGRAGHPSTHLFAVGVGNYTHLPGGGGHQAAKSLGLRQLKSPPVSVKALVERFFALHTAPHGCCEATLSQPLGTVHALASGEVPVVVNTPKGDVQLERATIANIRTNFEAWLECVQRHDSNVGVFYFCGHGYMISNHYLLADDFGESPLRPWERAFDITTTRRAVERLVKGALYFWVDSCREMPREVRNSIGESPPSLCGIDATLATQRSSICTLEATGEGRRAFAPAPQPTGQVSFFARALLKALDGFAGKKVAGQKSWQIDGEGLATSVRILLSNYLKKASRQNEDLIRQACEHSCNGELTPLLDLAKVPRVEVEIDYKPVQLRPRYKLYAETTDHRSERLPQLDGPLVGDMPVGIYRVGAIDLDEILPADERFDEDVRPPRYYLELGT